MFHEMVKLDLTRVEKEGSRVMKSREEISSFDSQQED
jgi:hypothetical protein